MRTRKAPKGRRPPPTPKQPRDWDIPPLPAQGDHDGSVTFAAVGMALSQWEYFEGYLGMFYGSLVGGNSSYTAPAMRAYGAVSAFSTRRDMIIEASSAYFFAKREEPPKQLAEMLEEAKNFAARRNEIAHGIVQPYHPGGLIPGGFVLGPSRYATRKLNLTFLESIQRDGVAQVYAYTSVELEHFRKHFEALAHRAMHLWMHISGVVHIDSSSRKKHS